MKQRSSNLGDLEATRKMAKDMSQEVSKWVRTLICPYL